MGKELEYKDLVGAIQFVPKFFGSFSFIIKGNSLYRRNPLKNENWVEVRRRDAFLELRLRNAPDSVIDAFKYCSNPQKLAKLLSETGKFTIKKITRVAGDNKMNRVAVSRELSLIAKELMAYPGIVHKRELYRPDPKKYQDVEEIKVPKDVDLEIWKYVQHDIVYGIAFQGRAQKPLWHYRFKDEAHFNRKVDSVIEYRKKALDRKKIKREEKKQFRHNLNVGDILDSMWGYDQTNINFYQVVGTTEKSVAIREVGQKIVKSDIGVDYVVPVPGRFDGPKKMKRVSQRGSVKVNSYEYASLWDGKPKGQTAFGYGH